MKKTLRLLLLCGSLLILLVSCNPSSDEVASQEEETPTVEAAETEPTAAPTATVTPVPERVLVTCLGYEPETLFLYGGASSAMWTVLEAIYDGPFDHMESQLHSVILEEVPSVENGAITFAPVDVAQGQLIVDAEGELKALTPGTVIFPAGCTNAGCAVEWQPDAGLQMDKMSVAYELLAGLTWSDGEPLTAADSVFSFEMGQMEGMLVSSLVYDRTDEYTAVSETGISWTGIPGYFPRDVSTLFAIPQPAHILAGLDAPQLLSAELPLGWGPYVLEEWVHGDHITLVKNDNYFRAAEGLPAFDRLVFRFPGENPADFLQAVLIGECDVVDRTANLSEIVQSVRIAEIDGQVNLHLDQGPDWTQLVFGINPASYDDGYNFYQDERVNYFSDARVRKAISACLNREEIVSRFYYDMVTIPESYLLPEHPLFLAGQEAIQYDPEQAKQWLTEAGWVDFGGETRVSSGVSGVSDNTPLQINLSMALLSDRERSEEIIGAFTENLRECGIGVTPILEDPIDLYAPGPDGRVFGRNFDIAQITWVAGTEPPCSIYLSDQIPSADNYWIGANVGGYNNEAFDAACQLARSARPDALDIYEAGHLEAQQIFLEDMPAIPLFFNLHAGATRVDFCNFSVDRTARSDAWNIELWDISPECVEP